MLTPHPETWIYPTERGLYCEPGQFFIDPHPPVDRAVITHGHGDHARSGHGARARHQRDHRHHEGALWRRGAPRARFEAYAAR